MLIHIMLNMLNFLFSVPSILDAKMNLFSASINHFGKYSCLFQLLPFIWAFDKKALNKHRKS